MGQEPIGDVNNYIDRYIPKLISFNTFIEFDNTIGAKFSQIVGIYERVIRKNNFAIIRNKSLSFSLRVVHFTTNTLLIKLGKIKFDMESNSLGTSFGPCDTF